jgi:hypothetical protein
MNTLPVTGGPQFGSRAGHAAPARSHSLNGLSSVQRVRPGRCAGGEQSAAWKDQRDISVLVFPHGILFVRGRLLPAAGRTVTGDGVFSRFRGQLMAE